MDNYTAIKAGEQLFLDGQIDRAEAIFDDIVKVQPDNFNALNNLGVIHYHRGNRLGAKNFFLKFMIDILALSNKLVIIILY